MAQTSMLEFELDVVSAIHDGTALYTSRPEIEALLGSVDWPRSRQTLIDPACGDGNMIIAALSRLDLPQNDVEGLCRRITGVEFHRPSALRARERVRDQLCDNGWSALTAGEAANRMIEVRDFLLTPTHRKYDLVLANPPYMRRLSVPTEYQSLFDAAIHHRARGDLLHAFLDRCHDVVTEDGQMALITSDRWLLNSGTSQLREYLGHRFFVKAISRLDANSAFHHPKERRRGTPPRVHPVSVILGDCGRRLTKDPFPIDPVPEHDGVPLPDIADIRLAPWLGPDHIFLIDEETRAKLPGARLVPCVEPQDIDPHTDALRPIRRWAIVTNDKPPPEEVMEHLDAQLEKMPRRGRRAIRWLPPERFDGKLPLPEDATLIPRIAAKLRTIHLPAGILPTNHNLVVVSRLAPHKVRSILSDDRVQAQANALAHMVDGGYRSYTASLLRQLIVPHDLLDQAA